MTSKAHVEYDLMMGGVQLAVRRELPGAAQLLRWGEIRITDAPAGTVLPDDAWLRLQEGDARAIYEALAEYFGHAGHDIRTLRRDYEAERKRVDKFIDVLSRSV